MAVTAITILGIDPGSRVTGYGVIASNGFKHQYIASGCIRTQGDLVGNKLEQIYSGIAEIIQTHQPHEAAIEQIFVSHSANSALKLGQARGAALVALAKGSLSISEYTARQVKQTVVGYGNAEKSQVQHMIRALLNLNGKPAADAADALAVAICHAQSRWNTSKN